MKINSYITKNAPEISKKVKNQSTLKQMISQKFGTAIISFALTANAAIVEDGLWTGKDWYDETFQIGVNNGVPYSNEDLVQHRLTAPLTVDGSVDETYLDSANVQNI